MADSATKSVDEPKKSKPLLYASNCVGILAGIIFALAGTAKVVLGAMDTEIYTLKLHEYLDLDIETR